MYPAKFIQQNLASKYIGLLIMIFNLINPNGDSLCRLATKRGSSRNAHPAGELNLVLPW